VKTETLPISILYRTVGHASVAYLRGRLVRAPPPFGRTAVIFVTILGFF